MDKFTFIDEQMLDVLSVPYEFGEWTKTVVYPYFVGEVTESPIVTEDGHEESTLILNGFHRGKNIDLEIIKQKIKEHFDPINGLRAKTDSGSIAVFFSNAFYIPTGEAELKRIQINLDIQEWKGAK